MADPVLGLDISRIVKAKPEAVFDAFTRPAVMKQWWGPEGMTCPKCEVDARPGGAYATIMRAEDGTLHDTRGTFTDVEPGKKLAYTWAWYHDDEPGNQTRVEISFEEKNGGTEVHLHHDGFETESECEQHRMGWTSSFNCLERVFA